MHGHSPRPASTCQLSVQNTRRSTCAPAFYSTPPHTHTHTCSVLRIRWYTSCQSQKTKPLSAGSIEWLHDTNTEGVDHHRSTIAEKTSSCLATARSTGSPNQEPCLSDPHVIGIGLWNKAAHMFDSFDHGYLVGPFFAEDQRNLCLSEKIPTPCLCSCLDRTGSSELRLRNGPHSAGA